MACSLVRLPPPPPLKMPHGHLLCRTPGQRCCRPGGCLALLRTVCSLLPHPQLVQSPEVVDLLIYKGREELEVGLRRSRPPLCFSAVLASQARVLALPGEAKLLLHSSCDQVLRLRAAARLLAYWCWATGQGWATATQARPALPPWLPVARARPPPRY